MKIFKIYLLSNFQLYNTVLLTIVTVLYLHPQDLSYNWKFVPFDYFHLFCPPTASCDDQSLCTYESELFLFVCFLDSTCEVIWYLSFCDLFHLASMPSSMLSQMARFHSFLWLNRIPVCWVHVHMCVCIITSSIYYIHWSMDALHYNKSVLV